MNQLDHYITNILDYNYSLSQGGSGDVNIRDIQLTMSVLNGLTSLTKDNHQTVLNQKLDAQMKDYTTRLGNIPMR